MLEEKPRRVPGTERDEHARVSRDLDEASVPIVTNHTRTTGPNTRPTPAVPRFWTRKSTRRTTTDTGTMYASRAGATTLSPSTAPSTEIAGVITPSP